MFKSLARIAIPLFKRGAKAVGKRALKAATEVHQVVLEGKNVLKSLKSRGSDAVKEFAQQGAKTLVHQTGRGRKRKRGQRSNLAFLLDFEDARENEINEVVSISSGLSSGPFEK